MTPAQKIIVDLDLKYPGSSTRSLARMVCREAPGLFASLECARTTIRQMRNGTKGHKKFPMSPTPHTGDGDPWSDLPDGDKEQRIEPWTPYVLKGPFKSGVLADIHIPFQNKPVLLQGIKECKRQKCNVIVLGGDIADCHRISKFGTDPRARPLRDEVEMTIDFLEMLREEFRRAIIIWKLGNHEERWINFMRSRCAELIGMPWTDFETIYELKRLGIILVDDKRPVFMGDLPFVHGNEYPAGIGSPVNAARGLFNRAKSSAMCAHYHRPGFNPAHSLAGLVKNETLDCWSLGCLCGLHPRYRPINEWQNGFAIVEVDRRGQFHVQNKVIKNGVIH